MKSYHNLGSFDLSGTGLQKFSISLPPKNKNIHLSNLILKFSIEGSASAQITKADFLRNFITKINLYINNNLVIDNHSGQSLHYISTISGSQYLQSKIPIVRSEGTFNVDYYAYIPFKNALLKDIYDFCISVMDIENINLEIQMGEIPNASVNSINMRVISELIERENDYYVPKFRVRKFTISKQISDIIKIPNRVLYFLFELPATGTLNDTLIMRTRNKTIIDNLTLSDTANMINSQFIIDDIQESDYNVIYYPFVPDIPISLKKPALYENEELFFDDMSVSNSPFDFIAFEIFPNEYIADTKEFESRYSPIKK